MNLDADTGLAILVDDLEGEVLNVVLDGLVVELLTDETFLFWISMHTSNERCGQISYDIENSPVGVASELILRGVSDKAFVVGESYPRGCDTVTCKDNC